MWCAESTRITLRILVAVELKEVNRPNTDAQAGLEPWAFGSWVLNMSTTLKLEVDWDSRVHFGSKSGRKHRESVPLGAAGSLTEQVHCSSTKQSILKPTNDWHVEPRELEWSDFWNECKHMRSDNWIIWLHQLSDFSDHVKLGGAVAFTFTSEINLIVDFFEQPPCSARWN